MSQSPEWGDRNSLNPEFSDGVPELAAEFVRDVLNHEIHEPHENRAQFVCGVWDFF